MYGGKRKPRFDDKGKNIFIVETPEWGINIFIFFILINALYKRRIISK